MLFPSLLNDSDFLSDFFDMRNVPNNLLSSIKTDIKETDTQFILEMDLPNFDKKDIDISVNKDILTIKAETKTDETKKDDKVKYHLQERVVCNKSYSRSFKLPKNANLDTIKASLEKGVLTISIDKQEVVEDSRKLIEID